MKLIELEGNNAMLYLLNPFSEVTQLLLAAELIRLHSCDGGNIDISFSRKKCS